MSVRWRHVLPAVACGLFVLTHTEAQSLAGIQLGSPEIFAPGIISGPGNDGSPTFSPEGNTLLFTRSGANWATILESHRVRGSWSKPKIASFSGEWPDQQPVFSSDGSYVIFSSSRPDSQVSGAVDATSALHHGTALWRVNRTASGWGRPVRLPATVNISPAVFRPSLAANGNLYFMALVQATKFRLFCSRNVDGEYKQAEALSFSDGTVSDVDPEVAPDESFLLFSSDGRRTGDTAHEHLYLVHKTGSGWGAVIPLLYPESETGASNDNDARCSRDLKMLYISSDRTLLEHHPMTREETEKALARLEWNNSNTNVWILPASSLFERQKS